MKREFKDLFLYAPYDHECLNSEITGEENGVASWLGIPFAKPPVGVRRFKAPEYVDESDRVFEARYYGKRCYGQSEGGDYIQTLASEDCLNLNIWVNTDDKTTA